jgi:hypothetical protein
VFRVFVDDDFTIFFRVEGAILQVLSVAATQPNIRLIMRELKAS